MEKTLRNTAKIRFQDCDPFSHLNNSRYIDYFLNAREDHLKDNYNFDIADIKPVIDKTFLFDEAKKAYEYLATGENIGKIVISLPG